jgi:hypothetical protein
MYNLREQRDMGRPRSKWKKPVFKILDTELDLQYSILELEAEKKKRRRRRKKKKEEKRKMRSL